ncbi:MAG: hypothetical protein AB7K86_13105 [Rhodospirillales bacterium]
MGRQFGPLTGREWLELDHWAFQELPRREYAAFRRLASHHRVPIEGWLERHPGRPAGTEAAAPRRRRAVGRT